MPGTEVSIDRNGPPVSVPGLGSQLSSWLKPPCMLKTTTRFCWLFNWAAASGLEKMPNPPTTDPAAEAASPARNPRLAIACSGE